MDPNELADAFEDAMHEVLAHYQIKDAELIQQAFELLEQRYETIKEEFADEQSTTSPSEEV